MTCCNILRLVFSVFIFCAVMSWLLSNFLLMVLATLVMSSAPTKEEPGIPEGIRAPQCRHEHCRYIRYDETFDSYYYEIEGNAIEISYYPWLLKPAVQINCDLANVLESPALPRVEPKRHVQMLVLYSCPLPTLGSLRDTLTVLNITFCEPSKLNDSCQLWLYDLPAAPPLTAKHLSGLDRLQVLSLYNGANTGAIVERGFLKPLKNLRKLEIETIKIPAGELDATPSSLKEITLERTGTDRLPKAIYLSDALTELSVIEEDNSLDAGMVPPGLRHLILKSAATTLWLDQAPALETLQLLNWVEALPPRLTHCDALSKLELYAPTMHALPGDWLKSCTRLEVLEVLEARKLITLPATLFGPGNLKFTRLTLRHGALEALPETLLEDLTTIVYLELDNNNLQTLPEYFFSRFYSRLLEVDFSSNDFDSNIFKLLDQVWSHAEQDGGLAVLNLSNNPRIGDACGLDGYSPLCRKTGLHSLLLSRTGVSRICKDWKEKMPELKLLDLKNTNISELLFEDLQYTRTVQAKVLLEDTLVAAVRVTRENYNSAVHAPPSFTTVQITREFECNCHMYWARRVLEPPLHALDSIRELRCVGGGLLRELPPEELECGARGECAAAALPAGCECAARPDDDTEHDRWLVRMRCENSSLGLVPRRIYPFYPLYKSNNRGFYLTQTVTLL